MQLCWNRQSWVSTLLDLWKSCFLYILIRCINSFCFYNSVSWLLFKVFDRGAPIRISEANHRKQYLPIRSSIQIFLKPSFYYVELFIVTIQSRFIDIYSGLELNFWIRSDNMSTEKRCTPLIAYAQQTVCVREPCVMSALPGERASAAWFKHWQEWKINEIDQL